jgi:hypothetical protein
MERLRPDVLFLSETHLNKARADNLRRRLNFDNVLVSESDGRSGGLLMLWQSSLNVTHKEVHSNYLDVRVDEHSDAGWRFTGLYGEPGGDRKYCGIISMISSKLLISPGCCRVSSMKLCSVLRKKEVISVNRTICKLLGIVYQIVLWRISVLVVINLLGDVVA